MKHPIEKASRFAWRATRNLLCITLGGKAFCFSPSRLPTDFRAVTPAMPYVYSGVTNDNCPLRASLCRQDYGGWAWGKCRDLAADMGLNHVRSGRAVTVVL